MVAEMLYVTFVSVQSIAVKLTADALGTNAEPKSPARSAEVAIAVANFFLMIYCESQSKKSLVFDIDSGLLCI